LKNKKHLLKYAIFVDLTHICGIQFYAFEYLDYLLKNNIDIKLILNGTSQLLLKKLINNKYDLNKLHPKFFDNIILNNKKILLIEKLIILDARTFKENYTKKKITKILPKKIFYNYANDILSLDYNFKDFLKEFSEINYNYSTVLIGDKEFGCKTNYQYPMCLNFDIFKKYKEFDNHIWDESQKDLLKLSGVDNLNNRTIKDFHQTFNTFRYLKNEKVWERANRLIPECKFYNKKIIFEPKTFIDSAQLRYERSYDYYDIWKFKSPDTNLSFAEFIQKY